MSHKIFIVLSWLFVALWMILIFSLSSIKGPESHFKSVNYIEKTITKTAEIATDLGVTKANDNLKEKIFNISESLNYPLRKCLHAFEYLILTLLLYNAFYQSGVRNKKLIVYSIIICFLYACSDEFHQLFRERTGSFSDVLLDTSGGLIALVLIFIVSKIRNRVKVLKNS